MILMIILAFIIIITAKLKEWSSIALLIYCCSFDFLFKIFLSLSQNTTGIVWRILFFILIFFIPIFLISLLNSWESKVSDS